MTVIRYTNARVFTGSDSDYDATELVIDDLTGRVLPNDVVSDQTINLSNKYVVPGLINAHTHIVMNPFELTSTTANVVVSTHNALKNLKRSLMAGVTTIRDVGSAFDIDIELAKLEAAGELSAPTILPSGGAISMTGGHGSAMGIEVDGPDEARKAARTNFAKGAKNLKLMVTGGISKDGEKETDIQLNADEIKAAVTEAHHKGYPVAAHAQGNAGIKLAVKAGVDSVEHAIYMDEEAITLMLAHNTVIVPTFSAPLAISQHRELPTWLHAKNDPVIEIHRQSIQQAHAAGIPIAMGTDAGTPFNDFATGVFEELQIMQDIGFKPIEILEAATKNAAKLLHLDQVVGTLEVGKFADFIVLNQNPLVDVAAYHGDRQVYKKGRLVYEQS